ncbi:hypothetical protein ACH5RR_013498 [Cinchona calisaya]|uniref:Tafazzin family protein n=1 Tax=Cinchona calisaya TaxID=153742 RepID=A0ABD3A076_9GENT
MVGRKMEWAASGTHLRGIPRKVVFMTVGAFAKAVANLLNTTTVNNADTLTRLVRCRPPGVPLLTVSNHMSTLDDPVMRGFEGFPIADARVGCWVLAAEDICFKNTVLSYFRLRKCIPITRGGGIYQEHMNEALDRLRDGAWWTVAYISRRQSVSRRCTPKRTKMVNCQSHSSCPCNSNSSANCSSWFGEEFDLPKLKQMALSQSKDSSHSGARWPILKPCGLDEAAQRWLYTSISEQIWTTMERLQSFGKAEMLN